jgi:hypothetical protein
MQTKRAPESLLLGTKKRKMLEAEYERYTSLGQAKDGSRNSMLNAKSLRPKGMDQNFGPRYHHPLFMQNQWMYTHVPSDSTTYTSEGR